MSAESSTRKPLVVTAWVFLLLASLLPLVFLQEVLHLTVTEQLRYTISIVVLLAGLALTFLWSAVRPLRQFFILFTVFAVVQAIVYTKVDKLPLYRAWLGNSSFNVWMPAEQSLHLIVMLTVIATLFILRKRASAFFLVKGDTNAPAEPVKLLGIKAGERWGSLGRLFSIIISLGTLTFLVVSGSPRLDMLVRVLPYLPVVLIAAVSNALYEEVAWKASFLSVLEGVVGKQQALWLMAAYFGIGHYYGVPYGIIGVVMAGFMGWFLGKSMLETRGLWWAWFIHFLQDVWIFLFLAIGSIIPGGG
ncbi:MAG: CPBP family intramembrane glutamic endopeptidase [Chloroflexota bacterium]